MWVARQTGNTQMAAAGCRVLERAEMQHAVAPLKDKFPAYSRYFVFMFVKQRALLKTCGFSEAKGTDLYLTQQTLHHFARSPQPVFTQLALSVTAFVIVYFLPDGAIVKKELFFFFFF